MADFLLVHGAWHGAWCWRDVLPALIRAGHRAHAVTLTGVGERAHLLTPDINLETHIQDVVSAMDAEELDQPLLVLHSYAGMLGTAIADRMPQRLGRLVYLDAMVPSPGEAWGDSHPSETRAARLAAIEASPQNTLPAPDASLYGLQGPGHAWVMRQVRPHPGLPYTQSLAFDPSRVARVPRTYVSCIEPPLATIDPIRRRLTDPGFWGGQWHAGCQLIEMRTGHDPMVSAPQDLVRVLLGLV